MSRQQKWQLNRPVRNKTSQTLQKERAQRNQQNRFEGSTEEFSVWKAYKPVLDEEEPMEIDDDSTSPSYQVVNTVCNVLGVRGTTPAWNYHKHGNEAMAIYQNATVWPHHRGLNNGQTVYKPHNEEFSVWKAYKPVLDEEEPMEIDDDDSTSPSYQVVNTGCNVLGVSGATPTWNYHKHGIGAMDIDQNAKVWLHHHEPNNGQIFHEPHNEEFSVWKAYKPILDEEEPMEIDDDETYQGENTGCNVLKYENGSSRFWKSSIFELDKGEPIAGNGSEKIRDKTNLDVSSPENFEDSDYEIPEDSDDVQEYYLSDAEFEEWLQDYMQQLNEDEELKQN